MASIWRKKFSSVTFLFLNIRYAALIAQVAVIAASTLPGIALSCKATMFIYYSMGIWSRIASAAFGAFRTWAIWEHNWLVLAIILSVSLVSPAIDLVLAAHLRILPVPGPEPIGGCGSLYTLPIASLTRLSVATRATAVAADAIILAATWTKTWSIHRVLISNNITLRKSNMPLSGLLLRDGTIYFAALLCINIPALVLDAIPEVSHQQPFTIINQPLI